MATAKPDPSRRARSTLSEKVRVPIDGLPQGMFIKGLDSGGPVLLFLHGGPGMPEYWLTRRYPTGLEHWGLHDPRGHGLGDHVARSVEHRPLVSPHAGRSVGRALGPVPLGYPHIAPG